MVGGDTVVGTVVRTEVTASFELCVFSTPELLPVQPDINAAETQRRIANTDSCLIDIYLNNSLQYIRILILTVLKILI